MICKKCPKQAKYVSPTALCLKHWLEWWHESDLREIKSRKKQRQFLKKELILFEKRHGN